MASIVMVLASGPGAPAGDIADRIELQVALSPHGQLDDAAYHEDPSRWTMRRTTPAGDVYSGAVVREDEGWAMHRAAHEDDPIWTFVGSVFRPGDYVTVQRPRGGELIYRIVAVDQD